MVRYLIRTQTPQDDPIWFRMIVSLLLHALTPVITGYNTLSLSLLSDVF